MKRTVEIARANIDAAIDIPSPGLDYGQVFTATEEISGWLLDRLNDSEVYLEATMLGADYISTVISAATEERRQHYQQQLTLLQTSVIGAAIMALTVVQALQYHLPVPGPLQAPAIATIAGNHPGPAKRNPPVDPWRWPRRTAKNLRHRDARRPRGSNRLARQLHRRSC